MQLILKNKNYNLTYLLALSIIIIGIVCSKALMSIGMVLGGLSLVLEFNFKAYFEKWRNNRSLLMLLFLYLCFMISLLWSQNIDYALEDLKSKLTLIVIPLLILSKPQLVHRNKEYLLTLFLIGVFITSLINVLFYTHIFGNIIYDDIRGMSLFGSHIRYSLLIAMGAIICIYFIKRHQKFIFFFITVFIWFVFYTYFSEVLSGVIALIISLLFWLMAELYFKREIKALFSISIIFISFLISVSFFMLSPESNDLKVVSYSEIAEEWNKRSKIPIHSNDAKGQELKQTLIRYLHSKSLPANSKGMKELTSKDFINIENGIADVRELSNGFISRLYSIRFELQNRSNPNGHSILQRIEYWDAAFKIAFNNPILGVGLGDVQDEFDHHYNEVNSKLLLKNRKRAHNMFLTFWVSNGLIGLLIFICVLSLFISENWKNKDFLALAFILISISSFVFEDTLETQTGITFFSFFYALFSINKCEKV